MQTDTATPKSVLKPSERARALPVVWRPARLVVYNKPSPPAVMLVGGGIVAATISVLAFLTPAASAWLVTRSAQAQEAPTLVAAFPRPPLMPGAAYKVSPPASTPPVTGMSTPEPGSLQPQLQSTTAAVQGQVGLPYAAPGASQPASANLQQQVNEDHMLIVLLAQHILGNGNGVLPQPLAVPTAGSAPDAVGSLPPPPAAPPVAAPAEAPAPDHSSTLYPSVELAPAATTETVTPAGVGASPAMGFDGPWPGWQVSGMASAQIVLGNANGDLRVIHVGDTFQGIRLQSVDLKNGVALTSAGTVHQVTSFNPPAPASASH